MGNISRLLQLEPRLAGTAASGKIVGILEKARQRREKRKRLEPSFAVFKYCSKKALFNYYIHTNRHHSLLRLVREQKKRVAKV